jgi:hypothetical protein
MSDLYQSLSHSKWDCKYHVVFNPKEATESTFWETPSSPWSDLPCVGPAEGVPDSRRASLIDRFVSGGPSACTNHPHPFFGPLTPAEWAILMYKHLDHHLRQFGV